MLSIFTTLLVFFFTLIFFYNRQKHKYWSSKNVPTPWFWPIIGNFPDNMLGLRFINIDKMYQKLKTNGYWGMYVGMTPRLEVCSPEYIKKIMVKDADHFIDRQTMDLKGSDSLFNEMLTAAEGEKWKSLRSIMSPTFTSGKIKSMFPLISSKVRDLLNECEQRMNEKSFVEMHSLFRYYTMDVIATCALGIDAYCLKNKESSQFIITGDKLTTFNLKSMCKLIIHLISPRLFQSLGLSFTEDFTKFYINVVEETVASKKKSKTKRGDFLDILLEALEETESKTDENKYPMTMTTIIAESILFLLAGFDTTSNALTFWVYLLAKEEEKQKILRKELQNIIQKDGELTYQNVMEAEYLDACLSESLRLYGPAHFTERKCTKPYTLEETGLEITYGTIIGIPIWSIHHDPDYWKDPYEFIPERFLPENKKDIKPYTYLPFGLGPRNCIGMRFAQLEAKLVIAQLVLNYDIALRPGFKEVKFLKTINTLRPDENGVQLVMHKL